MLPALGAGLAPALLVLGLLPALGASPLAGSAAAPFAQGPDEEVEVVSSARVQQRQALSHFARAHGGPQRLEALSTLSFVLTPARLMVPEGAEGEDAEPALVEDEPLGVEIRWRPEPRLVRVEDRLEQRPLVKISSLEQSRAWLGGLPTGLPEVVQGAQHEARLLFLYFEMILGLADGQLRIDPESPRTRGGVRYHCLRVHLPGREGSGLPHLVYLHPETGLVERIDAFDGATQRRIGTVIVGGYGEPTRAPRLPAHLEFLDRENRVLSRWTLSERQIDPELAPGRFQGP